MNDLMCIFAKKWKHRKSLITVDPKASGIPYNHKALLIIEVYDLVPQL